jgi:hypothetical protein
MEQKEVVEDLVGACAVMNKFNQKKILSYSYHSGGRTWPHGEEEGSGGAGWCLCNYEQIQPKIDPFLFLS